ncbi:ABC transporter substrate-binding protein [Herbiconiux sp. YIM B11900]|uniref:ABC transporter substrate-binding protein n=1 Tax=Herbiconiux sp. YIM B11900 TaxID=3404131 RepID=UPI003F856890
MKKPTARRATVAGIAVLVPAIVLALGGCAASSETADGPVTINFLNPHTGKYDAVIAEFEEQHPDITIKQQSVPYDELVSQTQARLSRGDTSIDVLAADPPRIANMVSQDFLTDESDALPEMESAFSAVGLESVEIDGKPYAYPMWTSDNFLFYNKTVLDKAGVAIPGGTDADRLTFEQVLADSKQIVDSGAAPYGFGIEQPDRYYALQPIAMGLGAGSGLEGDGNLTPAVDTPEWNEFGTWYQNLFAEGLSPKGVDTSGMPDLLMSGQIGYLLANPVILNDVKERLGDEWGIAPHPYFAGRNVVTPTDSWAFGISAFSTQKDAARTFVQFLTMNEAGIATVTNDLPFPPVASVGTGAYEDYLAELAPTQTADLTELLAADEQFAVHRPVSSGYVQFETLMNKSFDDIRNGADVAETLESTQAELERQLSRLSE